MIPTANTRGPVDFAALVTGAVRALAWTAKVLEPGAIRG
jgi:hypothetical protein